MSGHDAQELVSGWLPGAHRVDSPNFDERPLGVEVDLLVIHAISLPPGEFGGGYVDQLFTNRLDPDEHPYFQEIAGLEVSSHLLIERSGLLKQFVSTEYRAWHCGVSSFAGRTGCNDFSIGIELEGCDDRPFTTAQYDVLAAVAAILTLNYPNITDDSIVGHCDIAPGRKTDPGPFFEWDRLRDMWREAKSNLGGNPR